MKKKLTKIRKKFNQKLEEYGNSLGYGLGDLLTREISKEDVLALTLASAITVSSYGCKKEESIPQKNTAIATKKDYQTKRTYSISNGVLNNNNRQELNKVLTDIDEHLLEGLDISFESTNKNKTAIDKNIKLDYQNWYSWKNNTISMQDQYLDDIQYIAHELAHAREEYIFKKETKEALAGKKDEEDTLFVRLRDIQGEEIPEITKYKDRLIWKEDLKEIKPLQEKGNMPSRYILSYIPNNGFVRPYGTFKAKSRKKTEDEYIKELYTDKKQVQWTIEDMKNETTFRPRNWEELVKKKRSQLEKINKEITETKLEPLYQEQVSTIVEAYYKCKLSPEDELEFKELIKKDETGKLERKVKVLEEYGFLPKSL